jgi:tetratricopeptide (TPR) repeat protein
MDTAAAGGQSEPFRPGTGQVTSAIYGGSYGAAIQGRDFPNLTINTYPAPVAPSTEMQLPLLVESFVGRDDQLATLADLLNPAVSSGLVRVVTVVGLAGVGKTALASQAAHAAAGKGWFLGGILFADLHGYDDEPTQPGEMLERLLRALIGADQYIPEETEERAESYRSALSRISVPVLLVLDNVSAEAQVLQLLPANGPHRVLITSRDNLAGLDARQVDISVLDQETGIELLDRRLRTARPDDCRITGAPASAAKLAAACDGLPLALWISAAILVADPALAAEELAEELADERTRLEALNYDIGGPSVISVTAAFNSSYRRLGQEAARLFRLLSVTPGPHVTTASAAVLTDKLRRQARTTIGQLVKGHLIEPVEDDARQRWRMHDLMRLYASKLPETSPDEGHQARIRLLSYYFEAATYLDAALTRQPPPRAFAMPSPTTGHDFTDHHSAVKWAQTEKENLLACTNYLVERTADTDDDEEAVRAMTLAGALAGFMRNEGEWARSIDLQTAAIDTAIRLDVPLAEANFLSERGMLRRLTGHLSLAAADLERAIAIYREIGNEAARAGEAHALNNYGVILDQQQKRSEACQRFNEALAIYRRLNDQLGEANVLHDLGMLEFFAGDYDKAAALLGQALARYATLGQPLGRAHAQGNLARALHRQGHYSEAMEQLEAAQERYDDLDNQLGVVTTLIQRAAVLREHDNVQAVLFLEEAIEKSTKIGNAVGLVDALDRLADILLADEDKAAAIAAWTRALQIIRAQGLRREDEKLTEKLTELGLLRECSEENLQTLS